MSSRGFDSLPPELFSAIVELLSLADRLSLSSANSCFRHLLATGIFNAVTVTNQPGRNWHALKSISRKYNAHVCHLSVRGSINESENGVAGAPPEQRPASSEHVVDASESLSRNRLLPDTFLETLSGGLFTELDTIEVFFSFNFDELPPTGGFWEHESDIVGDMEEITSIYVFDMEEVNKDVIMEKEATYPWRALMAESWSAISRNHCIKKLVAKDLIPKPTSTFFTTDWSNFIGRLEDLDIALWSGDNGAGWVSSTLDGYTYFEEHLDQYFFQHAERLKYLKLTAGADTPFGAGSVQMNCSLPLQVHHLLELQRLELCEMFISPELGKFIVREKSLLKSLVLHNCHANTSSDEPDVFTWKDFFSRLDNDKLGLTELTVRYEVRVPMLEAEAIPSFPLENEDPEHVAELERLRQDPERMAFSYGECTDKYGDFWEMPDANYEHLTKGEDCAAWQSLMARVRLNAGQLSAPGHTTDR